MGSTMNYGEQEGGSRGMHMENGRQGVGGQQADHRGQASRGSAMHHGAQEALIRRTEGSGTMTVS